jgi:HEPN domain-containing protein
MSAFKPLDMLLKLDPPPSGDQATQDLLAGQRLEALHERVSSLSLEEHVPTDIHVYYDTIRSLMVFSAFHAGFVEIAAFLATTAVEMSLRRVYPFQRREGREEENDRRPLSRLLRRAVRDRRIRESEFLWLEETRQEYRQLLDDLAREQGQPLDVEVIPYEEALLKSFTRIRNHFAHRREPGEAMNFEMGFRTVRPCADIINQLFRDPAR